MLAGIAMRLADACVAFIVAIAMLTTLPLLMFASSFLLHLTKSSNKSLTEEVRRAENTGEDTNGEGVGQLAGGVLLFVLKGMAGSALLLQSSELLGGVAASWLGGYLLELAVHSRDASLLLLVEPPPQPLDVAFLLFVAPALAVPAGSAHGLDGAWHVYLCCAFFWRSSSASTPTALALTIAAYVFAWAVGVFEWRQYIATLGMQPADDTAPPAALLVAGVAAVLLMPSSTRLAVMPVALAFSPLFRQRALDTASHIMLWAYQGVTYLLSWPAG